MHGSGAERAQETSAPTLARVGEGRTARTVLFLVLLCAAVAFWRLGERPLFTAHEARAARCARHMLRSASWPEGRPSPWLVPQFSPYAPPGLVYQKPPLYYWLVAAVGAAAGEITPLVVRLPSAAALVALVVVVYFLGRRLVGHRTGLAAALVLGSTPKVLWWGRAAILDPLLTLCVTGALACFVRGHFERAEAAEGKGERGGPWWYYGFWALVGLGTLVKATALVVPLLAVGLYLLVRWPVEGLWGPLRRLRPVTGPLVLLAVAAPWHVAAHVATGGEFSRIYWGVHVFGRATGTSVFEDTTDPWFYLPVMARDLFPWVVFLPGALVQVWRAGSRPWRGRLLFPFAWFVGSFVFFSAVSFRKDEYMLVAYPGAALLVGHFLAYYAGAEGRDPALRPWVVAALVAVAVAAVALGAALAALGTVPAVGEWVMGLLHNRTDRAVLSALAETAGRRLWVVVGLGGCMAVGAVAAVGLVVRRRSAAAWGLAVAASLLAFVLFVETVVPVLGRVRGLEGFAGAVRQAAARRGPEVRVFLAVEECHELAFLLDGLADELWQHPEGPAFVRAETTRGRPWLVVLDRRDARAGPWREALRGWTVVAETPPGHRRPMVSLAPPGPMEGT